jgi:hypothetical protein
MAHENLQIADGEWITFPGGELEGRRPKALCQACRERLKHTAAGHAEVMGSRPLCFRCYRAGLARERALRAAGQFDTASEARFQCALPFEPVNRLRLEMLRAERASERATMNAGAGRFTSRGRQAQINAQRALQTIAAGLTACQAARPEQERVLAESVHAAELQLPETWIPFVVSR